jgi:4-hydroxy-tetrahydrodipicolinate synthase
LRPEPAALRTVIAVLPTPFHADGELNGDALRHVVDNACSGGVTVLTVNGNTGEFSSLSEAERAAAADLVIAAAGRGVSVIAGVGGDLGSAIGAARRAAAGGASAVMIHEPPGPFRAPAGWLAYQGTIADAVPDVGIVPYVRDPGVDATTLGQLFDRYPNVVAVKYAVADPTRFAGLACDLGTERVAWICGLAELWAPFFWAAGAEGFTSGLAAVVPILPLRLLTQLRAADPTGTMLTWAAIRPLEELRARNQGAANVPVIKEIMAQLGLGGRTVRPPIVELSPADRERVAAILASWQVEPAREAVQ